MSNLRTALVCGTFAVLAARPGLAQPELRGTVLDAGGPAVAASVELAPVPSRHESGQLLLEITAETAPVAVTESDDAGGFRLPAPRPGAWALIVRAEGSAAVEFRPLVLMDDVEMPPLDIQSGCAAPKPRSTSRLEKAGRPGRLLCGRIVDAGSGPIAGVDVALRVRAEDDRAEELRRAASDPAGHFEFLGAPTEAEIELRIVGEGYAPLKLRGIRIPPGREPIDLGFLNLTRQLALPLPEPVEIVLVDGRLSGPDPEKASGEAVEGWITTTGGDPVAGVRVTAGRTTATSDGDGWYRLGGLAAGPAALELYHPEHPRRTEHLEVRPGVHRLDWTLDESRYVRGWVVDEAGEPVADAGVTLGSVAGGGPRSYDGHSTADGYFELGPVAAGRYRLGARRSGYAEVALAEHVTVGAEATDDFEIVLTRGASIGGRIAGLDFEELARVRVRATGPRGRTVDGSIDEVGRYEIVDRAPGDWLIKAELDGGRRHAQARLRLAPGVRRAECDLEFGGGLTLSLQVLFRGEPLAGAAVSLSGYQRSIRRSAATDESGELRFEDLDPGSYRLELTKASELVAHNQTVHLDADRILVFDLDAALVQGRILSAADYQGLPDALVSLRRTVDAVNAEEFVITAGSDAEGFFEMPRVPPGRYRFAARRAGYAATEESLEIRAGLDSTGLELSLSPTRGLDLNVRLASGHVPDRATVYVFDAAGRSLVRETRPLDEEGNAHFATVPPGSWRLLVSAPGGAATESSAVVPGAPSSLWLPAAARLDVLVPDLAASDAVSILEIFSQDGRPLRRMDPEATFRDRWPVIGGRTAVEDVPGGVWLLRVSTLGGEAWSAAVTVTGDSPVTVTLE